MPPRFSDRMEERHYCCLADLLRTGGSILGAVQCETELGCPINLYSTFITIFVGCSGWVAKCWTVGQGTGVQNDLLPFQNLDNFTHPTACILENMLKAVDPFYLVSMPGEVKDPMWGGGVNV